MQRSPRTRFAAMSLALVATLGLAACGDDDDDTSGTDATVSTEVETTDGPETTSDTTEGTTEETTEETTDGTTEGTTDGSTEGTGGGEVGSREEYVAVTKEQIGFSADEEISTCVAEAVVTDDVYAAIEENGRTVEDFQSEGPVDLGIEEDHVLEIAAAMSDCGELIPLLMTDENQLACAEQHVDNTQMAELIALSSFGLELTDELESASDEVQACIEDLASATTTS